MSERGECVGYGAQCQCADCEAQDGVHPGRVVTPCPTCGMTWFHKEGCHDPH